MQITPIPHSGRMNSIEDYRKNFSNIREFLDSPQEFSLDQKRKLYKHFFEGERKNFTISNLAKWEMYRNNPQEYPYLFRKHLNELCLEINSIQDLRLITIQKKQKLYEVARNCNDFGYSFCKIISYFSLHKN